MLVWLLLPFLGFATAAVGTMVGAGGGFLLAPMLLLLYPGDSPELLTRISLTAVFFNAVAGAIAYARQKRIDYKTGLRLAPATVPGAVLGALATRWLERETFNLLFGLFLTGIGLLLLLPRITPPIRTRTGRRGEVVRELRDAEDSLFLYSYRPLRGLGIALGVGFVSSLFGIGGGFVQVPAFVFLLNFPTHIAVATSQFMLTLMSLTGVVTHLGTGTLAEGWRRTALLVLGVVLGAPVGARIGRRVRGHHLQRLLGLALLGVGTRLLSTAF